MGMSIEVSSGSKIYRLSTIRGDEDWEYWLENEEGEAMSISEKNIFDIFDKEWQESF
jgi:hypothetical protein